MNLREKQQREEVINYLLELQEKFPDRNITRDLFRDNTGIPDSAWVKHFGNWHEFKRQSGIKPLRQQHLTTLHAARHASLDHYRELNNQLNDYDDKYVVACNDRYRKILVASDFHDKHADRFTLDVIIDTAKRIRPHNICLAGDIWDALEFGRYTFDVRDYDLIGSMNFLHDEILKPLRDASPDSQIDFLAGNHEMRLLKHLADNSQSMQILLSEFHGMTFSNLLGLDKYNINFYSKMDMSAYTKTDMNNELRKNNIIYDDCFFVSHYPNEVRRSGMSGVAGHHHKHIVWSMHNRIYGTYEVHQLAAVHKRDAVYCDGNLWGNGFAIITIDRLTKSVFFDYVDTTNSIACVGGKYYYRG